MYFVSELFIYPIKSLGGIALNQSKIEARGLQYDRRWMLCNKQNEFITQRENKNLALFKTQILKDGFAIHYKNETNFEIPFSIIGHTETVKVWDDECEAIEYTLGSAWFSKMLNFTCKLFYMPNQSERKVSEKYAHKNEITSFSDGFPILIIGQESLNFLNAKLPKPIGMDRFRPNIVFTGGKPFDEDHFKDFSIGKNLLKGVKPCSRCVITTIDQNTTKTNSEPLKTLATFRNIDNNVLFGQNLITSKIEHEIKIGDEIIL